MRHARKTLTFPIWHSRNAATTKVGPPFIDSPTLHCYMHDVVPSAVRKAVSEATIIFATTSKIRYFFMFLIHNSDLTLVASYL